MDETLCCSDNDEWREISLCSNHEVDLDILMNCGQSFRWKKKGHKEWIGVIGQHVWHLFQTSFRIRYKMFGQKPLRLTGAGKRDFRVHWNDKPSLDQKLDIHPFVKSPLKEELKTERNGGNGNHFSSLNLKKEGVLNSTSDKNSVKSNLRVAGTRKNVGSVPVKHERLSSKIMNNRSNENPSFCLSQHIKTETPEILDGRKYLTTDNDSDFRFASVDCEEVLRDYFQLNLNLEALYDEWSSKDSHFKEVAGNFKGIRMLRQDPVENLISFICSSNNNISRITSMVEKLAVHYGDFIAEVDGEKYFSFPTLFALTGEGVEDHLRQLGFGYRAKFISKTAQYITQEKGDDWLHSLRTLSYQDAKRELMTLMGVGAKVADCVCLMSLDKTEAVPVDTHVWQITVKNYMLQLDGTKSLTNKIYNDIGAYYRELWGPYAGWAHSVLFTADLKFNKAQESGASIAAKEGKRKDKKKSEKIAKGTKKKRKQ